MRIEMDEERYGYGYGQEKCRRTTWEEDIYWRHFQTLQFCQILPSDFQSHLVIPKKFAQNMWYKLPRKALLKGPSGATWNVELKRDADDLCFLAGWGEFVEACSLKENDLLIFKYSGDSQFDVLMFDAESLCEKESVYFVRKCGHPKPNSGNQQKRDKRDNIEEQSPGASGSIPSKQPRKSTGKELVVLQQTNGVVGNYARDGPDAGENLADPSNTSDGSEEVGNQIPIFVQHSDLVDNRCTPLPFIQASVEDGGEQRKGAASSSLLSPNDLSVEQDATNGNMGSAVPIPSAVQQSTPEGSGSRLTVTPQASVEAGRWQRKRKVVATSSLMKPKNPSIRTLSRKVRHSKMLKGKKVEWAASKGTEGLAFETPTSAQLSVLEVNGKTPRLTPQALVEDGRGQRKRKIVASCCSMNQKKLPVKKDASKRNKESPIQTPISVQQSPILVQQSALKDDDGSTPRVIPQTPEETGSGQRKRKTKASRSLVKPSNPPAKQRSPKELYTSHRRAVTDEEKAQALKTAMQELADESFLVVMPPTAVYKRFYLSIPADWAPKHLSDQSQVTLCVGPKKWVTRYRTAKGGRTGGIGTGWKRFAMDNCLEEFDVCVFKLTGKDSQGIILDVSIFRVVLEAVPLTRVD